MKEVYIWEVFLVILSLVFVFEEGIVFVFDFVFILVFNFYFFVLFGDGDLYEVIDVDLS